MRAHDKVLEAYILQFDMWVSLLFTKASDKIAMQHARHPANGQ